MRNPRTPLTSIALLLAAGLAMTGCDTRTDAGRAVQYGSRGITSPAPEKRGESTITLKDVVSTVKAEASKGSSAEGAAANTIVAQAQASLAVPAYSAAFDAASAGSRQIEVIRSIMAEFRSRSALAAALATYNPDPTIADIEKASAAADAKATDVQKSLDSLRAQESGLRAKAKERHAKASEFADQAARLRKEADTKTATVGLPLIEQARELTLKSEAERKEGGKIDLQADAFLPRITEAELELAQARNNKADAQKSIADLRSRATEVRKEAEAARAGAAKAAGDLTDHLKKHQEFRTATLGPAFDKAQKDLRDALSSANEGGKDAGSPAGKLTAAGIHHRLGDLHAARGASAAGYANILDTLATVKEMTGHDGFKTEGEAARTQAKEAFEAAAAAYDSAKTAYGAGKTKDKEQIERLNTILDALSKVNKGESLDLLGQYIVRPKAAAAPASAVPAGIPADLIRDVDLASELAKEGKVDQALEYVIADDAAKKTYGVQLSIASKFQVLDAKMKAKFGKGLESLPGVGAMSQDWSAAAFDFTMTDANTAAGKLKKAPAGFPMPDMIYRKQDGKWKLDLAPLTPMLQMAGAMLGPMEKAIDGLIADVDSGKLKSPEEVMQALSKGILGGG